ALLTPALRSAGIDWCRATAEVIDLAYHSGAIGIDRHGRRLRGSRLFCLTGRRSRRRFLHRYRLFHWLGLRLGLGLWFRFGRRRRRRNGLWLRFFHNGFGFRFWLDDRLWLGLGLFHDGFGGWRFFLHNLRNRLHRRLFNRGGIHHLVGDFHKPYFYR